MPDALDMPDYANPPVVETVLGVQFDRLPLKNAHLGAFWKTLDASLWPTVMDAPLLPSQHERFDATAWERAVRLQLTEDPAGRAQIRNADANRMIQLQKNRLHLNWLGTQGDTYPRYDSVRTEFVTVLNQFAEFVSQEKLGEFRPNQWEVTYVNQIPQGTVWTTPADWGFFRPLGTMPTIEGVIEGESFAGEWHFVMPDKRGRLHINWQHGKEAERDRPEASERKVIRLTLTARGSLAEVGDAGDRILEGLDLGRATIVRSFRSLMSEDANRYWGLKT